MAAGITDKFNQATASTRPVPTTLTASRAIGAATISCGALTGWPTSTAVHFIIYTVDTSGNKVAGSQTDWKGIVSGTTITNCTLKAGSDAGDSIGAIVECGPTAAWANDVVAGAIVDHDQLGQHKTLTDANGNEWIKQTATASAVNELTIANAATGNSPIISATGGDSNIGITLTPKGTGNISMTSRADGWVTGLTAPSTVTALGNRSYSAVISGTDYTDRLSPGMRLKFTRTVTAPTQCTDLESGSSQYYSKTSPSGMTFTDDFVVSAWIKLESYTDGRVISRYNGTSGWELRIGSGGTSDGRVQLVGYNGASANFSSISSLKSLPLNQWVHVSALLDMSAFTAARATAETAKSWIMIDGVEDDAVVARGGTNPTALVQAGNLNIGASNSTNYLDGKIAQVAVYSTRVTQANIRATMSQGLSGSETSLISAYSFNNSIADLNTGTANNLTAQGSAVATNADTPFAQGATGTTEYGIVTAASFSTDTTLTVQVPKGSAIPTSGGISEINYSTQKSPFGFPLGADWSVVFQGNVSNEGAVNASQIYDMTNTLTVPVGSWKLSFKAAVINTRTAGTFGTGHVSLSTSTSSASDGRLTTGHYHGSNVSTINQITTNSVSNIPVSVSTATPYYFLKWSDTTDTSMGVRGDVFSTIITADLSLV